MIITKEEKRANYFLKLMNEKIAYIMSVGWAARYCNLCQKLSRHFMMNIRCEMGVIISSSFSQAGF